MFNSAYNQSHPSDRGYSTSNHNPRALLGSGNTYWSNANRNDGQTTGIGTTQRSGSDLNGVGSSTTAGSGGGGRSGKTMTWASVASQPTVKPVKAHSLRSKMANSSSSGSSLASFSSTGAKSLPPPIVTPPISSVPPPVAQPTPNPPPMIHSQPTLDPNLRPRDVDLRPRDVGLIESTSSCFLLFFTAFECKCSYNHCLSSTTWIQELGYGTTAKQLWTEW